jgi:vacuolar-type H+-ATPase subunit F/Vma7
VRISRRLRWRVGYSWSTILVAQEPRQHGCAHCPPTPARPARSPDPLPPVGFAATQERPLEQHDALIAVIGDEDTVTGMLLAGVGNVDSRRASNFFVCDSSARQAGACSGRAGCGHGAGPERSVQSRHSSEAGALSPPPSRITPVHPLAETTPGQVEEVFTRFTTRNDIAVVLINQYVRGPATRACAWNPLVSPVPPQLCP